jgi:hypothetical protein
MATVGLAASILLLAAANEWKGSLLATVNGLWLPRSVRMMLVVTGVMSGDFRQAMTRVHHAFTAQGKASPKFSFRNLVVLPHMLACVWAAVLCRAAERLDQHWSSPAFWDAFIPRNAAPAAFARRVLWKDAAVLASAAAVSALSLWTS